MQIWELSYISTNERHTRGKELSDGSRKSQEVTSKCAGRWKSPQTARKPLGFVNRKSLVPSESPQMEWLISELYICE